MANRRDRKNRWEIDGAGKTEGKQTSTYQVIFLNIHHEIQKYFFWMYLNKFSNFSAPKVPCWAKEFCCHHFFQIFSANFWISQQISKFSCLKWTRTFFFYLSCCSPNIRRNFQIFLQIYVFVSIPVRDSINRRQLCIRSNSHPPDKFHHVSQKEWLNFRVSQKFGSQQSLWYLASSRPPSVPFWFVPQEFHSQAGLASLQSKFIPDTIYISMQTILPQWSQCIHLGFLSVRMK